MSSWTYLVQFVFALLGIVDGGLVSVMEQLTRSNEAIAAIVARSAGDKDSLAFRNWLQFKESLRDAETGQFHELIN